MKILILFLFIGIQMYYTNANQPFYWSESGLNITALEKIMNKKCTDPNNKNRCEAAGTNYDQCTSTLGTLPSKPAEDYQGFCRYLKGKQLGKCIQNLVNDLSPALDETEKYLQHLLLNGFNAGLEEFCGVDGFSNTKYFFDTYDESNLCMSITVYLSLANGTCISDLNVFRNLDKGVLNLNKQDVCLDLESLQKCISQVMKHYCERDFSRFVDLIFRPFLEECNILSKGILD